MRAEVFFFWVLFLEVESGCEAGRASWGRGTAESVRRAGFSRKAPPGLRTKMDSRTRTVLAGVQSQRGVAEQVLKRPAAGEVNANAASRLADAGADFEKLGAQSFDLCRTPRLRQLLPEEVDQVVGGGMQQQAEGVGQETVTAQAVGAEAVLEFLDAVLALAAVVVESKDLGSATGAVGNQKAQVGSGGRVFGLVADAAQARPTAGAMAEAGKAALRHRGSAIAAF